LRARLPALLIWIAYFVVPTDAGGVVGGLPLGIVESAAILALCLIAATGTRLPAAPLLAGLAIATAIAAAAIPGTGGLRARYFANAVAAGTHERSIEFRDAAFTRIDRRLEFAPGGPEFPLPFFNDNSRFNFYKAGEPRRGALEFAVRWSGMWWANEQRPRLYLDGPGAIAEIFIDGAPALTLAAGQGSPIINEVPLSIGWHRLDVTFSSPYESPRRFSAGVMDGDRRVPFDGSMVVSRQMRGWQMTAHRWLRRIKAAVDIAVLIGLGWLAVVALARSVRDLRQPAIAITRRKQVLWLFTAAAAAEALIFASPWATTNMVLAGGDDTMTYEGYARDILFNGILMNGGAPLGQGEPFYYQAFYPYFLAATHAVFGEMLFGAVLIQRLLAIVVVWKLVEIAVALGSDDIWKAALPLSAAFVAWKFWPIAAQPLNESLYVPLLVGATASFIDACRRPTARAALASGIIAGVTAITRSTVLLSWVIVWMVEWRSWRSRPRRSQLLALTVASTLAIFSLIGLRNWLVAARFVPASTEFGITLLGGNELPEGVTIDLTRHAGVYRALGIGELTATVVEYAITEPGLFAANLGRKTLFALGFYESYAPGWGSSPVYIAVWMTAIAGVGLAFQQRRSIYVALPALIAIAQFIAVVIVYPKGERLILPIHTLLVPYSSLAAWQAARWLGRGMLDSSRHRET
jgi:hypothetical protein